MGTNHKPIIRGTDTGIWQRVDLIPFTVTIPEEKVDKHLVHHLRAELPGICAGRLRAVLCGRGKVLKNQQPLKMR